MADNFINNPIAASTPAYEAVSSSHYASRYAEAAAILEQLVARIEQTSRDIEAALGSAAA